MVEVFRRSVTTSPTLLYAHPKTSGDAGDYLSKRVALINTEDAPVTVYLGASDVATGTGARWIAAAGRTLSVELEPGESLYAVVASGTQAVDVLVNGR